MRTEAIVEVYGTLSSDLMMEAVGDDKKCGLITVSIGKRQETKASDSLTYKVRYFPVIIWNQELISAEGHRLKQGVKVLIIGELDIFSAFIFGENSQKIKGLFDKLCGSHFSL